MKGKYHLLTNLACFIPLWLLIPKIQLTEIIFPIILATFPDLDLGFKSLGHRSALTHSLLLPLIVYMFNPYMDYLLIILSVGIHLICDTRFAKGKQKGFYCIKVWRIKHRNSKGEWVWKTKWGLNGFTTTLLLEIQFAISVIIFLFVVLFI
ncbi:MAG: hypothetical protein GY870_12545 [archaeon]|nr:hypothetical protein [archaeon]